MIKMKLSKILSEIAEINIKQDREITGIAIDSRQVKPGDLFLAYRGEKFDGHDFIDEVIKKGASAVIVESKLPTEVQACLPKDFPLMVIPSLKKMIKKIAATFYGDSAKGLTIIGVTGTNGKTSCTHFIASLLAEQGVVCGIIGTIGIGFPGKLSPINNTTPDVVTLERWFYEFKKQGAKAIAMEVSSHSLVQAHRTQEVDFDIAVFTNLTRDHLDYHGSMENYGAAKKLLFFRKNLAAAVINADDDFGRTIIQELSKNNKNSQNQPKLFAYSINHQLLAVPMVEAENIRLDHSGITAKVMAPWGEHLLHTNLWGKFNLSNILAALGVLKIMGVNMKLAVESVKKLTAVPGRMQTMRGRKNSIIVVDYAHTPDALEQTLISLRQHCKGAIWCIFGCGGDRDRGKRPLMGKIAERYSDHIIITNDNPRSESPRKIIDDILSGLLCPWAVEIEPNRRVAITHAIDCAEANDVILIAGKGHESYQIIGNEKFPFSDIRVVEETIN